MAAFMFLEVQRDEILSVRWSHRGPLRVSRENVETTLDDA